VTGSGTTGRLAKWAGSRDQQSFYIDDPNIAEDKFGNVGIGGSPSTLSRLRVSQALPGASGAFALGGDSTCETCGAGAGLQGSGGQSFGPTPRTRAGTGVQGDGGLGEFGGVGVRAVGGSGNSSGGPGLEAIGGAGPAGREPAGRILWRRGHQSTRTSAGNLSVAGMLSKGGGSFKIDHPLDPENKYLFHSFVESPDMMNIYNGTS